MLLTRRWALTTAGLAAGFSGLAVLATIMTGQSLVILEALFAFVPLAVAVALIRRAPSPVIREVTLLVRVGIIAGAIATVTYDVTRTLLSYLDPSPYNPFEAVRRFGLDFLPADAPVWAIMAAGLLIHLLNGSSFGVIYAVFAGRYARTLRAAMVSGIVWGLTLEFIQSILYPGWLQITTVLKEFLFISAFGHVFYGMSLGLGVRRLLARQPEEEGHDGRA
jgi:hypothetical protein